MRMKIFLQLRRRCTEKEKEEEEIFGEGKDMFCRREENGDGKGENLLEKECHDGGQTDRYCEDRVRILDTEFENNAH